MASIFPSTSLSRSYVPRRLPYTPSPVPTPTPAPTTTGSSYDPDRYQAALKYLQSRGGATTPVVAASPGVNLDRYAAAKAYLSGQRPSTGTLAPALPYKAPEPKAPSLWQQAGHLVSGIGQGLVGTAKETAESVYGAGRLAVDLARMRVPEQVKDPSEYGIKDQGWMSNLLAGVGEYTPVLKSFAESGERTVNRITNPTEYAESVRKGTILQDVVEDIANVSLAGGAAAKVLGAGERTLALAAPEARAVEGGIRPASVGAMAEREIARPAALAPVVENRPLSLTRYVPPAPTLEVTQRGTGLAGMLERAGAGPGVVRGLETTGRTIRNVSHLGERVGNVPAWPVYAAYSAPRWALERLGLPQYAPGAMLGRAVERAGTRYAPLWRFTEEGRKFGGVRQGLERSGVETQRYVTESLRIQNEYGLNEAQSRAVLDHLDRRTQPALDMLHRGNLTPDQFAEVVRRTYETVEPEQRPTAAQIQTLYDYETGRLDPSTKAAMDAAAAAVEEVAETRTDVMTDEGMLAEEQTQPQLRPSVIREAQRAEEYKRNRIESNLARAFPVMSRAERIDLATQHANALLPPPPAPGEWFGRGLARGRMEAIRREHARTVRELQTAINDYAKLPDTDPAVAAAADNVDRLTQRASDLRDLLARQARGRQAAEVLSRVGEPEAGPARTLEGMTPRRSFFKAGPGGTERVVERPQPVIGQRGAAEAGWNRPEIDVSGAEAPARIKARAAELAAQEEYQAYGDVEHLMGGNRPGMPEPGSPEHRILMDEVSDATRRRMQREGWLRGRESQGSIRVPVPQPDGTIKLRRMAGPRPVVPPMAIDQLVDIMEQATGRTGLLPDEAFRLYIDAVQRYWEAKSGTSETIIRQIADETGLSPEAVNAALTGKASDYRGLLSYRVEQTMDDLRSRYEALRPDERQSFDSMLEGLRDDLAMQADPAAAWDAYGGMLDVYMGDLNINGRDGIMDTFAGQVPIEDVVTWMRTGDMPATMRATLETRTRAQNAQLGRMAGEMAGTRARLRDVEGERRAAVGAQGMAERAARRGERRAARRISEAARREEAARPAEGPLQPRPSADRVWQRFTGRDRNGNVTTPYSRGERARLEEGVRNEKARAARLRVRQLERSRDAANQRIADMPVELGRSHQDRLVNDINRPAIRGFRNAIRRGGKELGGKVSRRGEHVYVDGQVGRLARKYGVQDRVADLLEEGGRTPLAAVTEEGGTPLPEMSATDRGMVLEQALAERGIVMEDFDQQALVDSVGADQLLENIAQATLEDSGGRLAMNTPFRVRDLIENTDWIMPDDVRSRFRSLFDRYEKRRDRHLDTIFDTYAEAAPGKYRPIIQAGRRQMATLVRMAEEANAKAPGSGDLFLREAEDTITTLQGIIDNGIDPTHLIGGDLVQRPRRATGIRTMTVRGTKRLETGLRAQDLPAYARAEADQAAAVINNRNRTYIKEQFGHRVDEVIGDQLREHKQRTGEDMTVGQMNTAVREAGFRALPGDDIAGPQSIVLFEPIVRQMDSWVDKFADTRGWQAFSRVNRGMKNLLLPLSSKWMTGNVFGNVVQAAGNAGTTPYQLAKRMLEVRNTVGGWRALWDRTGLPPWVPAEISSHGLHRGEFEMLYEKGMPEARNRASAAWNKVINFSYKLNEFTDNLTRSAVYLDKLKNGVPSEAAMQTALRSLGDFTRMTPIERRIIREIIPFYPWLRHQTLAALRLPITSPTRAAWLMHLSAMYSDPEYTNDMLRLIGSKIPLGGDRFFDFGTLSPYPTELPLPVVGPRAFGQAISPALRLPYGLVTGTDLRTGQQYTRPYETYERGPYGQELATPPLRRPLSREVPYIVAGEIPYVRSIRDLLMDPSAVRYATGYPTTQRGQPIIESTRTPLSTLLRGANIPQVTTIDLEEMRRRAEENLRRQRG